MNPTLTIARRELKGYFASPVAFVFIVIFLLLASFFTFMIGGLFERGEANSVRRVAQLLQSAFGSAGDGQPESVLQGLQVSGERRLCSAVSRAAD